MANALSLIGGSKTASKPAASSAVVKRKDSEIESLKAQRSRSLARAKDAGRAVIGVAEMGGSAFAAGAAYGYLGDKKMQVMGVDIPVAVGAAGSAYGLYKTMKGQSAGHVEALSNGLLAAGLSRVGARLGRAAAVNKGKTPESLAGAQRGGGSRREVNGRF